jgi:predicted HicB family RNase H-like nuclease
VASTRFYAAVCFCNENKKRGRTSAQDKYDKANVETVSFKTKKGARSRLKEAAAATNQSTNGFIRAALNKAVQDILGFPMEYAPENEASTGQ